jgi:low affinity Fe/Cu permease
MKKNIVLFLIITLLSYTASSQIDKMREKLNDAIVELDEGKLTLRFFNAETGDPVREATVAITDIGIFTSDPLGIIRFPISPIVI